ncbi:hypothetical protein [uncultured Paraglaciecola sp.]|uniref:hypothetical protein n=1 Tax=uncultured Paraglaciecola sp. TaxID=1765024 RepID=UPI00259777B8|nr:hypothetical protein [uncultured Paraglaciecola sp.]
MKNHIFVIITIAIFSFQASATRVVSCNEGDAEYITNQFSSGNLNPNNKIVKEFLRGSLSYNEICEVRNQIIMDGLGFTLYKPSNETVNYIAIYNGLDGSYVLYGPLTR